MQGMREGEGMREPIKAAVRREVVSRFGGRCGYCGELHDRLHVDHIRPIQRGGTNETSNLMPACQSCNIFKSAFNLEEFREQLGCQVAHGRRYSVNFRMAERFGLISVLPKVNLLFYFERQGAPE